MRKGVCFVGCSCQSASSNAHRSNDLMTGWLRSLRAEGACIFLWRRLQWSKLQNLKRGEELQGEPNDQTIHIPHNEKRTSSIPSVTPHPPPISIYLQMPLRLKTFRRCQKSAKTDLPQPPTPSLLHPKKPHQPRVAPRSARQAAW